MPQHIDSSGSAWIESDYGASMEGQTQNFLSYTYIIGIQIPQHYMHKIGIRKSTHYLTSTCICDGWPYMYLYHYQHKINYYLPWCHTFVVNSERNEINN